MPFGATTPQKPTRPRRSPSARPSADLVDRAGDRDQVYKGTYPPLYSYVVDGLTGANQSLKDLYGDGNGRPSLDKAKQALQRPASPPRCS